MTIARRASSCAFLPRTHDRCDEVPSFQILPFAVDNRTKPSNQHHRPPVPQTQPPNIRSLPPTNNTNPNSRIHILPALHSLQHQTNHSIILSILVHTRHKRLLPRFFIRFRIRSHALIIPIMPYTHRHAKPRRLRRSLNTHSVGQEVLNVLCVAGTISRQEESRVFRFGFLDGKESAAYFQYSL